MSNKPKILFCSSGKTYGHFLKIHALYLCLKDLYDCVEVINPTEFTKSFRSDNQIIQSELKFANNSFTTLESLQENVTKLVEFLKGMKPDVVVGDKLPNLMTACVILGIKYISVTHVSQINHNWSNTENPNLFLFNELWTDYNLKKPVDHESWFFFRNWGNLMVFGDDEGSDTQKLDELGYKYSFLGNVSLSQSDEQNHGDVIKKLVSNNNFKKVVLLTFSSHTSQETDKLLVDLATNFKNILFVYPQRNQKNLLIQIKEQDLKNIYLVSFIDYSSILGLTSLVICVPGRGTLNIVKDYPREILGLYVNAEQASNALLFKHPQFSFYKLSELAFDICAASIENAQYLSKINDKKTYTLDESKTCKRFKKVVAELLEK